MGTTLNTIFKSFVILFICEPTTEKSTSDMKSSGNHAVRFKTRFIELDFLLSSCNNNASINGIMMNVKKALINGPISMIDNISLCKKIVK